MKFLVCNRLMLDVDDRIMGVSDDDLGTYRSKDVANMPYSHAFVRRGHDVAYGSWCYEYILKNYIVPMYDGYSLDVVEYCAGLGRASLILDDVCDIDAHTMVDIDSVSCGHLKRTFPNEQFTVICGDYKDNVSCADLACFDFNTFTITKLVKDELLYGFIEHALKRCSVALITDTAISRLHLNLGPYSRDLECNILNIRDYMVGMSRYFCKHFGFEVAHVIKHHRASYMLMIRDGFYDGLPPFAITEVPKKDARSYFRRI